MKPYSIVKVVEERLNYVTPEGGITNKVHVNRNISILDKAWTVQGAQRKAANEDHSLRMRGDVGSYQIEIWASKLAKDKINRDKWEYRVVG